MERIDGTQISKLRLFYRLRKVADLICFDGPVLTHLRSDTGENYLNLWCDRDAAFERWLLFSIEEENLHLYMDGVRPLRTLILEARDGLVYVLDIANTTTTEAASSINYVVAASQVPTAYLPSEDSLYEFEAHKHEGRTSTYSLALNNAWSLDDLKALPHLYTEVYVFSYAFKKLIQTKRAALQSLVNAFPWRGGFSSMHFYHYLRGLVPKTDMPEIRSMHIASPGWIEMDLFQPAALEAKDLILKYWEMEPAITSMIDTIYDQLRIRKLIGSEGKEIHDQINADDLKYCKEASKSLAALMGYDVSNLAALSANELALLKILVSFYRRIQRLAQFSDDRVTF